MVEMLYRQDIAVRRSHSGFSIELLILYCLGKQLISKQVSRHDFKANKQASNQASREVFCLLAFLLVSLAELRAEPLYAELCAELHTEPLYAELRAELHA